MNFSAHKLHFYLFFQNNIIGSFVRLEQILMTNGYSKEDLIIVNIPTADQVSVLVSSASLMADQQESLRKSNINEGRKTSTSSIEKKVSFDRGISIQEEDDPKTDTTQQPSTSSSVVEISNGNSS